MTESVNVVVVGLGFGRDFLPIYADHPNVGDLAVVEPDTERRTTIAAEHGVATMFETLDDALDDPHWDAVHLLSPVRFHAAQALAVLGAGKHCASAVPMATSIEDMVAIIDAAQAAGRNYMMMETAAYMREYLTVEDLYRRGELGEVTLYRGFHIQNLDGYPDYWSGFPPMRYVTHALTPALALLDDHVATVRAMGTGRLEAHQQAGGYDNTFSSEVGLFELAGHDVVANITMSFFRVGRSYVEGFDVYGDAMGVEWPSDFDGPLHAFRLQPPSGSKGLAAVASWVPTSTFPDRLPEPIRRYTEQYDFQPATGGDTIRRSAEHGGSHPHLVHEFVSSIVEKRQPRIDAVRAAQLTAPGVVAHLSAQAGGVPMEVPRFG